MGDVAASVGFAGWALGSIGDHALLNEAACWRQPISKDRKFGSLFHLSNQGIMKKK